MFFALAYDKFLNKHSKQVVQVLPSFKSGIFQ